MPKFIEEFVASLRQGRPEKMLRDHCRRWREHQYPHVMKYGHCYFAQDGDHDNLFEFLTDPKIRNLKEELFGRRSLLQGDLLGLEVFSQETPDLLRYLRLLVLTSGAGAGESTSAAVHEQHCRDFADFLQLDCPVFQRQQVGVHRILHQVFPLRLSEDRSWHREQTEPVTVQLDTYELGSWQCRCGGMKGHARRFDYRCECGAVTGNGKVEERRGRFCKRCGSSPAYVVCSQCGSRVSLELLERVARGGLHPSELKLPLCVSLKISFPDGSTSKAELNLMSLPLMLGLEERDGQLNFVPPAAFWIDRTKGILSTWEVPSQVVAFRESMRYDRQTRFRKILEAMFRRTLYDRRKLLRRYFKRFLENEKYDGYAALSQGFLKRLTAPHNQVAEPYDRLSSIWYTEAYLECRIASSPEVSHGMAVVNHRLLATGEFTTPYLEDRVAVLTMTDELTPQPLGQAPSPSLAKDGIVAVGALLEPGDRLVGIESTRYVASTPEERLLETIFGQSEFKVDRSLMFSGRNRARVVSVKVTYSRWWDGLRLSELSGRTVHSDSERILKGDDWARITVSLAVEETVGIGDLIVDRSGNRAVICDVVGPKAIRELASLSEEPDVVVAPDHAWAPAAGGALEHRRIKVDQEELIVRFARGFRMGPYSIISNRPLMIAGAQVIEPENVDWLLAARAPSIAFELSCLRCDCARRRFKVYEEVAREGEMQIDELNSLSHSERFLCAHDIKDGVGEYEWRSLAECPGGTVRHFGQLLVGLRIRAYIIGDPPEGLAYAWVRDKEVRRLSSGHIQSGETLNYQTGKPVKGGLLCERIFGPIRDHTCACGELKGMKHRGVVCDRCGVEVMSSSVRGHRIGHLEIPAVMIHPLLLSRVCRVLAENWGLVAGEVLSVAYYGRALAFSENALGRDSVEVVNHQKGGSGSFSGEVDVFSGAMGLKRALEILFSAKPSQALARMISSAFFETLIVVPPGSRPCVPIEDRGFTTGDLNTLYREVVGRCYFLKRCKKLRNSQMLVANESGMVQSGIDALYCNERNEQPLKDFYSRRPLKSLVSEIESLARNRRTLLGGLLYRPIEFSGRTRMTVGDSGNSDIGGLPEELAWDLLWPLILHELAGSEHVKTIKAAKSETEARTTAARQALAKVCENAIVVIAAWRARWNIVALRVRPQPGLSLVVSRGLMDHLGWDNLGQEVRIFPLFSREARREACEKLLPSKLEVSPPKGDALATQRQIRRCSALALERKEIAERIVDCALGDRVLRLTAYDRLALGLRESSV